MTREEAEALAAEYVLGTLDAESRARFANDLARDAGLQALVADWEKRLSPLAESVEPVRPSASVWSAIEAALDAENDGADDELPGTLTVKAEDGDWREIVEGVTVKMLFVDRQAGFQSYLMRLAPGAGLPEHPHSKIEECYVIEGEVFVGSKRFKPGDYHLALEGATHPPLHSVTGALVFLRSQIYDFAA